MHAMFVKLYLTNDTEEEQQDRRQAQRRRRTAKARIVSRLR
jgi:hypothetical protein